MKKIKSTIAMEPERVVIRTGDLETVFTYPPSATGPQIAVSAADQIAILHTLIANKRLDCERLRASLRAMDERFGHFAAMRTLFPNEVSRTGTPQVRKNRMKPDLPERLAVLLADLAGMVHEAAGGEE